MCKETAGYEKTKLVTRKNGQIDEGVKNERKKREKKKNDNPFVKKSDCASALTYRQVFFLTNDYHFASEILPPS